MLTYADLDYYKLHWRSYFVIIWWLNGSFWLWNFWNALICHSSSIPLFIECQTFCSRFISSLSKAHQQIITLLFGTWFRIVSNSDINAMTVEALARSCAGSMFHTCAEDPGKVEKASRIMQLLIDNFGSPSTFGRDNIEYFTEMTSTGILVREKFRYQYHFPSDEILPRKSTYILFYGWNSTL